MGLNQSTEERNLWGPTVFRFLNLRWSERCLWFLKGNIADTQFVKYRKKLSQGYLLSFHSKLSNTWPAGMDESLPHCDRTVWSSPAPHPSQLKQQIPSLLQSAFSTSAKSASQHKQREGAEEQPWSLEGMDQSGHKTPFKGEQPHHVQLGHHMHRFLHRGCRERRGSDGGEREMEHKTTTKGFSVWFWKV